MKHYYRVMLGRKGSMLAACLADNYVGVGYALEEDLTNKLPDDWRTFNREFIPKYLATRPDKSRIAAGLACGVIWTVSKGINIGDIVICPDGTGKYHVGEVTGAYFYVAGAPLLHRRPVHWLGNTVERSDMSPALRGSTGATGTVSDITRHSEELEKLFGGNIGATQIATEEGVEDPAAFVMEKHLEDFLVENWSQTDLGKGYDIYEEDGEKVGQQYATDTGPVDILAIRKDKKELLVVELKKGRASDAVVGQLLRYMGYVQAELAEKDQIVRGAIIALEDDQRIRRALTMTTAIDFYRYQISFRLVRS